MSKDAVGTIVMYVNGQEFDILSVNPVENTGNRPVKTMNSTGRTRMKAKSVADGSIQVEVVIPDDGSDLDWLAIEDARITLNSPTGQHRKTYMDVNFITIGEKYQVDGEAVRSLDGFYLDSFSG